LNRHSNYQNFFLEFKAAIPFFVATSLLNQVGSAEYTFGNQLCRLNPDGQVASTDKHGKFKNRKKINKN